MSTSEGYCSRCNSWGNAHDPAKHPLGGVGAARRAHAMGAETVEAIYYGAAHYLGLTHNAGPVIRADNPKDRRRLRDAWQTARRIGR